MGTGKLLGSGPLGAQRDEKGISTLGAPPDLGEDAGAMTPGPPAARERRVSGLGYLPALDGLRAVAVAAVLLYHADLGWFSGGFLGVDVFFVLSGYLITCVLLDSRRTTGRIRLRKFWGRRARRLLPALLVMLAVVCVYTVVVLPGEAARLRDDVVSALAYVMNWHLTFQGQSYFESFGRAPLLQHLWSLSVEEQFYLVWPMLLTAGLAVWRGKPERLAIAILGLAGVSTLLMAVLYRPGGDPSRVYYATDTHASGLLIGAALAVVWPPWRIRGKTGAAAPFALETAGLVGLAVLGWCFLNVSEFDTGLYRGGYLAVALVTGLVVAVVVHPAARLTSGVLALRPLRWIGQRSYGIYLWHWPVYLLTRPGLDVPLTGIPLLALRLSITVGLAAASFRYVEEPIRSGALGQRLRALRRSSRLHRQHVAKRLVLVGGVAVCCAALVGVGLAAADPTGAPRGFPREAARIAVTTTTPASTTQGTPSTAALTAPSTAAATPPLAPGRVIAIGDSVMLGAQRALVQFLGDRLQLDANVSRHMPEAIDVVRTLHAAGQLGDEVVLHLGTNGALTEGQFDEMMQLLRGARRVVVVNARVDRPWEQRVNDTLAAGVPRYPNAVLFDWNAAGDEHPEFFVADGVHLTGDGARYYALLITSKL
jgi:peptidoglycan/LPS O-acetylase OafA/YrhL